MKQPGSARSHRALQSTNNTFPARQKERKTEKQLWADQENTRTVFLRCTDVRHEVPNQFQYSFCKPYRSRSSSQCTFFRSPSIVFGTPITRVAAFCDDTTHRDRHTHTHTHTRSEYKLRTDRTANVRARGSIQRAAPRLCWSRRRQ